MECAICQIQLTMADAHIDERGWLCDACYFANQPWHNDDDNGSGGVGC